MHLLEARALCYRVGSTSLVHEVSLVVDPGEVLVLVGPNGAGKSTLLRLVAGDLRPTSGEILLDGKLLAQQTTGEQALRRAVLRQHVGVSLPFTVFEIALMGRHPHLRGRPEGPADRLIAQEALGHTEMLPFAERVFPTLSGGEQARASLTRVLAQQTSLLLLDEPTAALDLRHQHAVLTLLRTMALRGATALAVLHDLNLAALYADRIGLLHQGRLLAIGTPWEVLRAPLLSEMYNVAVTIVPHPQADAPLVLVVPAQQGSVPKGGNHALVDAARSAM